MTVLFYLANNLTLPGQILAGRTERGLACTYPLVILFGIFSLFAAEGHAQGSAASIPVGDARLTPALDVEYVTSDNAFLAPSNEVSSTGVSISPSLTLSADKAQTAFDLSYRGRFAAFDEDELDFADHFLTLNAGQGISRRLRLSGSLGFAREHSDTFTNLALGSAEGAQEQVSFDTLRANASLTYGAAAAKGNVRIGFGLQNRSPNNFESLVGNSGFDSARTFAEFLLRISSDTRFVTGIEYSDVDYDRGATRDREAVTA
ncbi:MAG: hypothetical protein KTR32_09990, partial [Granulosicoccus sp.]|nr:hypothetical protein [Granulosicoccus sp.]